MKVQRKCFVIMPFSKTDHYTKAQWEETYKFVIKPAVEESGFNYDCERSSPLRENIQSTILRSLKEAHIVIADLTDGNPNVFYELGIRHVLEHRTILIARMKEDLPFHLITYPAAFYGDKSPTEVAEFKNEIKDKFRDIEQNPDRPDNPVTDFLKERNIVLLSQEKSSNSKKLMALISELSYNISTIDYLLDVFNENRNLRKNGKGTNTPAIRFDSICIDLLLSTRYIEFSQNILQNLRFAISFIRTSNTGLQLYSDEHFGKGIENKFLNNSPSYKSLLQGLLTNVSEVRSDYLNNNYQEPPSPILILSRQEHEQFYKSS